ncbi:MAG TPA: XdhC family protein [Candidatus Deferrimicrobium sp.]|nr:XdhC family protein [Candidatus Deferrimicrobium sp.]
MKEIASIVRGWKQLELSRTPAVLATVVKVAGSAYRHPGARVLVSGQGIVAGNVSGGCLEADVLERATAVLNSGQPCVVRYDTSSDNDLVLGTGMGCGGVVDILVEAAGSDTVRKLMTMLTRCCEERHPTAVATVYAISGTLDVRIGDRVILTADSVERSGLTNSALYATVIRDLREVLRSRQTSSKTYTTPEGAVDLLLEYVRPPVGLAIFGAGDDAFPLYCLAESLSWQVTIVDHRPTRVKRERFPKAASLVVWAPHESATSFEAEPFEATVVMTHNYLRDLELLAFLLPSTAKYIGLLGATKRADRLLADLSKRGLKPTDKQLSRLFAPVGLDLGAEGPWEIALSIAAEIQAVLTGAPAHSLRDRQRIRKEIATGYASHDIGRG